jgi:hypothetical protein
MSWSSFSNAVVAALASRSHGWNSWKIEEWENKIGTIFVKVQTETKEYGRREFCANTLQDSPSQKVAALFQSHPSNSQDSHECLQKKLRSRTSQDV